MHHGIGSPAVSTVFCVPTSCSTTNGFISKRIPSELGWSSIGNIGRIKSGSTIRYRRVQNFARLRWQAERLPYNICLHLRNRHVSVWLVLFVRASRELAPAFNCASNCARR
jgi:hypothetical protein